MAADDTNDAKGTVRLVVQLAAVAFVVALPWVLNQRLIADALTSQDWVAHTIETKGLINQIKSSARDTDRILLRLALNPGETTVRRELAQTRADVDTQLARLATLVADNVDQRARAAQLQALSDTRVIESNRVLERLDGGDVDGARAMLANPVVMVQLQEIGEEIVAEEDRLLQERREIAVERRNGFTWATTGIAALQLILLAAMVGVSERQHRRRRDLETQTREARQRSDLILNAVRKPIALLDRELRILLSNPAFESLYAGAGGQMDLVGRTLGEVGDGAWSDAALQQKLRDVCYLGRELWDHEVEQNSPSSGRRILMVNARRTPGSDATNATLILTANDITATRTAERQIRELNDQLGSRVQEISEANRELESFSYSVSHDLRAPLRHIAAFADKLDREVQLPGDSKAAHYLRVIGDSSRRMGVLIDELLIHSKLGRSQFRAAPVAMDTLVEEVRAMLLPEIGARSVKWEIQSLPTVYGDSSMLRLIWQNLIGNAVKYTARREHAIIKIEARHDPVAKETVFHVGDNGAGFDMAYVDKLFGVFQRLHSADDFPGTGIGLANVRRIVGRHGGRVWAESEPGRGAQFFFSLPDRPVISGDAL
jgi:signal transduction histidine kinase